MKTLSHQDAPKLIPLSFPYTRKSFVSKAPFPDESAWQHPAARVHLERHRQLIGA
ncbi:hypothetical protein [Flavisolibacter nicotianae]|uniref:hypothetical protein n=1 Tax=Flavisolibacter nicotianae TaxID=2364882 RepID=UPI0013C4EAFA|nr:hypothetical protein [Flavisolibacter nicotianae]